MIHRLTDQQDKALCGLAETIGRIRGERARKRFLWQVRLIARVCLTLQGWFICKRSTS